MSSIRSLLLVLARGLNALHARVESERERVAYCAHPQVDRTRTLRHMRGILGDLGSKNPNCYLVHRVEGVPKLSAEASVPGQKTGQIMAAMDTTADSATATLEDAELQAADAGEPVALGAAAATLMLAYISADQLEDARHLWRRTPEAARAASGDLRGAWAAAAALRGRAAVPSALAALDAGPWGAAAAPLAAEAAASARRRELDVIGAAYLEIRLAKVAAALAQSDQVALEACRARGWVYRAQEATLVPRPPAPAAPAFESFEQLAQLTRIATHLTA